MTTSIKIVNAQLDVRKDFWGEEQITVKGVIDPASVGSIKVPTYQRELLSEPKIVKILEGWRREQLPDISLGMRGENILEREGAIYLQDPVFVIDGQQRMTAAQRLIAEGFDPHIGAMVYLDTSESWERQLFEALNLGQTKLSTNVILRNRAEDNEAAKVMFRITEDKQFVLFRRISWNQAMRRGDLITAVTYYKTVGRLHSFAGSGKGDAISIAEGLHKIIENVGKNNFMFNVREFFQMINEVFGIENISYRAQALQLKNSFLMALAGIVSDHENFWDGDRLVPPTYIKKRLAHFPTADPYVTQLASGAGGASSMILEQFLIEHLNAGRKTRQLKRRSGLSSHEIKQDINGGDDQ